VYSVLESPVLVLMALVLMVPAQLELLVLVSLALMEQQE
jgi:hypothetical protein